MAHAWVKYSYCGQDEDDSCDEDLDDGMNDGNNDGDDDDDYGE